MSETVLDGKLIIKKYKTLDSTNNEARRYAADGGSAPALFVAEEQTGGRGRMGRSFYSPARTGLYMSLLLDVTQAPPASVVKLTCVAAVAAARAIKNTVGVETGVKWVNDLYLDGKKVCGILAESFSLGDKRYAVVGVGVNLWTTSFPSELDGIAGCVTRRVTRDSEEETVLALALSVCEEFFDVYENGADFIEEYRSRSVVLGKRVVYTVNGQRREGVAEDITDGGGLVVTRDGGEKETLSSGEITLRPEKQRSF